MGRKAREKQQRPTDDLPVEPTDDVDAHVASESVDTRHLAAIAFVIVALVALIFAQLRTHDFLNYDDDIYVTANQHVRAGLTIDGIRWAFTSMDFNWHPLTWLTHMLDVQLFGVHAGPPLLVNALLHAINAVLLLLLLVRATRQLWSSAFVAALFAVHPLHVESVAWLAERKDVLSTLFFLLALYLYVRFTESRSKWTYAGLTIAFVLGLMSKGMLVTLPFVLLLLDYWPLRRLTRFDARSIGDLVVEKLPLFVLVVPAAIVTYEAQRAVSALAEVSKVPMLARLANAALSYVAYIAKMFWPVNLAIPYPYRVVLSSKQSIAAAVLLFVVTALVIWFRRSRPWLITGWLWFLGTLVPVIGIVQIGHQAMADRYTYVPLIGLFIAITWSVAELLQKRPQLRTAVATAAVTIVLASTWVAHAQAGYWKTSETLFTHTVAVTKRNTYAHAALGKALLDDRKDPAAAARAFQAAVEDFPGNASARHDLAVAYNGMQRLDDASREMRQAINLSPKNAQWYSELASIDMRRGRNDEAVDALTRSAAAQGDSAAVATLALKQGDIPVALRRFEEAIRRRPQSADVRNDYAAALAKAGRDDDALKQYEEALRLNPSLYDARMNLGALLSRHDRNAEAIAQFEQAVKLRPDSTEPRVYLALGLAQSGRAEDAARQAEAAMAIDAPKANEQFTSAVHAPPNADNLRQFIAQMRGR